MRISLNWLRELVAFDLSAEELAEKLTLAGFEVEDIEDRRTWAEGVVVGKVIACNKHPDADKLSVCQVDIGAESPSTIVCGAPNVKADLFVPVATLGTYLPKIDLKIKPAKLRGVASEGMICSLTELGLNKESDGIHSFDSDSAQFKVGDDVRPLLGLDDVILDLTSTANRADALSMVGIAREVSALTGAPLTLPKVSEAKFSKSSSKSSLDLTISISDPEACTAYIATYVENIKIAPSPEWLQRRLEAAGTRPINNVVDVTNYILLEWGQPLHGFDANALQSGNEPLTLGVRMAQGQETLTTLDGQTRNLSAQNLLITANDQPVAIAGVMGGADTEVRPTTTNLILEAALFSAISIRRSARSQGLRTEASTRYERGANEAQLDIACAHALALLQELAGGRLVTQQRADHRASFSRSIELRLSRVNKVLGPLDQEDDALSELSGKQVADLLESLGFKLKSAKETGVWQVEVPPHRYRDIEREIDLIEEIARLHGYEQFCETLPAKTEPGYLPTDEIISRKIREAFRASGLTELVHYTWSKPGTGASRQISVVNPLLVEFSALRTEMISGLLNAFQYNQEQGNGPLNGFELGRIFWQDEEGLIESAALAGIMSGKPIQGQWQVAKIGTELTWFEAKGRLESAFNCLGLTVEYQPDRQDSRFHPGRTASLWLQGERLGRFGQVHPKLRQDRDLPVDTYVFELNLDVLLDAVAQDQTLYPIYRPYSTFPAADRDLAFFVSTEVSVTEIERAMHKVAQSAGKSLLASVELFDEYRGEHVPNGQRSLAFRLVYRAADRTLTEEEVNPIHQKVRDVLEEKFQVSLRS